MTIDRIHVPLIAYACHPHSNTIDLCFGTFPLWLVFVHQDDGELIAMVPFTQAPTPETLGQYLRLCDYRGTLTVDDA